MEPDGYRDGRSYPLVILMHGYGSNMSDLAPLAPMISREGYLFAFPNAPIRLDFGLGMIGYAWSAPRSKPTSTKMAGPRVCWRR